MVELQYFGHSFFRIKDSNGTILIDPIFESTKTECKKNCTLPAKMSGMKNIALILLTNETAEHFDREAVQSLALKNNATVVAHDVVLQKLSLPRTQKSSISSNCETSVRGYKIKTVTAHYPNSFYPMGYMIECEGAKIYHAGVTALLDTFDKLRPDVALLPISSRSMDVIDAVRATKLIKPKIVIPMQYDVFEQKRHDPTDFKKRIEDSVLKTKAIILLPGQKTRV